MLQRGAVMFRAFIYVEKFSNGIISAMNTVVQIVNRNWQSSYEVPTLMTLWECMNVYHLLLTELRKRYCTPREQKHETKAVTRSEKICHFIAFVDSELVYENSDNQPSETR